MPKLSIILSSLTQKGWLNENIVITKDGTLHSYTCHPLIRYVVFEQMKPNMNSVYEFLEAICKDTGYDAYKNPIKQAKYIEELENLINRFQEENMLIVGIYCSLEYLYLKMGNPIIALKYGKKYLSIIENIKPEDENIIAKTYGNIAEVYRYLKDYEKALDYNLKAITIIERILHENHADLAVICNNISMIYLYLKDYEKALDYNLKAITIYKKVLPENHTNLINSLAWQEAINKTLSENT